MITRFSNINAEAAAIKMRHQNQAKAAEGAQTPSSETSKYNKKLKEACNGFEELFVHKMIQVMRESSQQEDNIVNGGHGEEIFQDMLDQQYAKIFTKTGSLGLANMIYENTKET